MKTSRPGIERLCVLASTSEPDKEYVLAFRRSDRRFLCSCPHFIFRLNKEGGECKHIMTMREMTHFWSKRAAIAETQIASLTKVLKAVNMQALQQEIAVLNEQQEPFVGRDRKIKMVTKVVRVGRSSKDALLARFDVLDFVS